MKGKKDRRDSSFMLHMIQEHRDLKFLSFFIVYFIHDFLKKQKNERNYTLYTLVDCCRHSGPVTVSGRLLGV